MKKIILCLIITLILFSCKKFSISSYNEIQQEEIQNYQKTFNTNFDNAKALKQYQVEKAFEIDGVIIYKFYYGQTRFVAVSKNSISVDNSYSITTSNGKSTVTNYYDGNITTVLDKK